MLVLPASCRDPSSPRQTGGPRGQQLGGDGPLAASGFVRSLCCQQLRCGVQTGRCVCVEADALLGVKSAVGPKMLLSSRPQTRCSGSRWPAAARSAFRSTRSSPEVTTSSGCEPPTAGGSAPRPSPQIWSRCPARVSQRAFNSQTASLNLEFS